MGLRARGEFILCGDRLGSSLVRAAGVRSLPWRILVCSTKYLEENLLECVLEQV